MVERRPDRGEELTPCPHCGRMTRTVGHGACADCWQAKTEAGRPVMRDPGSRTEPFLDLNLDWFELMPGWMWLALALGCGVSIALTIVLALA